MRFTVHRPPCGEVSLCWYRPSGGDIAGCVHVGVARRGFAGDACEDRLALAVFARDVPTYRASLRRVRGCDPFEPARGLVVEPGNQPTPPLMTDGAVEAPFLRYPSARVFHCAARGAGHRPHVEVLHANGVESARQIGRRLFDPIASPVGFTRLELRNRQFDARSAVGATLARARRCSRQRNRVRSPGVRPGACSNSPVDNAADTDTPRSTPTTLPSRGPSIASGMCANATCQRPARSRVTR